MSYKVKINKENFEVYDNVHFTSDLHFNHLNIIKYCGRPYGDLYHMNENIIRIWNEVVRKKDVVFVHGDFVPFEKNVEVINNFLSRLNGTKYLIKGNHDDAKDLYYGSDFNNVYEQCLVTIEGDSEIKSQRIFMNHYPMINWNYSHKGSWQTYGHIHSLPYQPFIGSPNQVDVGWDRWKAPIDFEALKTIITKQNLYGKNNCTEMG